MSEVSEEHRVSTSRPPFFSAITASARATSCTALIDISRVRQPAVWSLPVLKNLMLMFSAPGRRILSCTWCPNLLPWSAGVASSSPLRRCFDVIFFGIMLPRLIAPYLIPMIDGSSAVPTGQRLARTSRLTWTTFMWRGGKISQMHTDDPWRKTPGLVSGACLEAPVQVLETSSSRSAMGSEHEDAGTSELELEGELAISPIPA
mmetsp:Transcript_59774/g.146853  ORF Transcript_59774/g.146853 Transcript_59774/m.146853 type:complete len:204 (-) Transcript_59774:270-881(-)